jgi:hypothetical protein
MSVEHSRPLRLGELVTAQSKQTLLARLQAIEVGVSVDAGREGHAETARLVLETVGRLPVSVALDPEGFTPSDTAALEHAIGAMRPNTPLRVGDTSTCDIVVHVGSEHPAATVSVIGVRHGARLGRKGPLPDGPAPSGLGIMTAAALAAAEVFKIAADVLPGRAVAHQQLSWCPVALSDRPEATPALGDVLDLDLAVVGVGAVGSAAARILSLLAPSGRLQLIDPERFGQENLGTYSLGTHDDGQRRPWKVDLAAKAVPSMSCEAYRLPVEQFIESIDAGEATWPRVVLSGLDSVHARREVQRLWPDRLIDGATGDTMCGLHDVHTGRGACLMCLFPVRIDGPSAAERLSHVTGLPTEILRYGDQLLTEAHLAGRSAAERARLEPYLGTPICGLAQAVGLTALPSDDYRPSVSFVSQQAACLIVGRLLADVLGLQAQGTFVQYDALVGPQAATVEARAADERCMCQRRARLVDRVRRVRGSRRPTHR